MAQIPGYVSELTPMVLIVDTRVTNHGYRNGAPTTFQAVLQAEQPCWSTAMAFPASSAGAAIRSPHREP